MAWVGGGRRRAHWWALGSLCVLALPAAAPAAPARTRHAARLHIAAAPALFPAFNPHVPDYVVRCFAGQPIGVFVSVPRGMKVAVGGRRARSGSFSTRIRLASGQAFAIVVTRHRHEASYEVRCLPRDFPQWTAKRFRRPQAAFYLVAPCCVARYVAIFDNYGVPLWWLRSRHFVLDAALLPDGDVEVGTSLSSVLSGLSYAAYREYRLNGAFVRTFSIPGGIPNDRHETLVLANGNYLALAHTPRSGVDLSRYGGPSNATVFDADIEEVSPHHELLWSWNSSRHIGLDETGRWYQQAVLPDPPTLPNGTHAYDIVHINSVMPYRRGFLISLRHTDAIYYIDKATGGVIWKLGGTPTSHSLKIIGDNHPDFGGQHDVRALPDGTITLLDNGTGRNRPPRALRFRIDEEARTATEIEDLPDRLTVPDSPCCGSARKLPGGDWVVSWGSLDVVSELTPSDAPVLTLTFPAEASFRAIPILPGQLSRGALNAAMDRHYQLDRHALASRRG
jgi:arylsulfotransferase ASST